jgi:hypothetical protein
MIRTLLLCTVLLAGCDSPFGAVQDRPSCLTHADCPVGQYCATTSAGGTCWEDAVPPTVASVQVTCSTSPCLRDARLTVSAAVSDAQALLNAAASLDLDGGVRQVAMHPVGGGRWEATLELSEWPVDGLTATATASVTATDGARNVKVAAAADQAVTRVRPAVALDPGAVVVPTAPALEADGAVVVGGSTGRLYTVADGATAATASTLSVGAAITFPPVLGQGATWVAAGNRLFAVKPDGSALLNGVGYDTGGAVAGPAALTAASAPEVAFVGSAGGRLAAVQADAVANGFIARSLAMDPVFSGPALATDSAPFVVTGSTTPATATLRGFTYDGALGEVLNRTVASILVAPLAVSSKGSIWTAPADVTLTKLQETTAAGTAGTSIPLPTSASGGPIILSNGDVAICAGDQLHRFTAAGAAAWAAPVRLDGIGLTPLALAGPGAVATLLVPTRSGTVHAVRASDGALLWSASLSVNELREGTVRAAAAARTSTAWFTSADGLLHGLVVDGALDTAAPWPKAWHDGRNTGNLATPH